MRISLIFGSTLGFASALAILPPAAQGGQLDLANRQDVESAMKRTLPTATCERRYGGKISVCQLDYADGGMLSLQYATTSFVAQLFLIGANRNSPSPEDQSKIYSMESMVSEFGFSTTESNGCVYFGMEQTSISKTLVHQTLIMECSTSIHPSINRRIINIKLRPNNRF